MPPFVSDTIDAFVSAYNQAWADWEALPIYTRLAVGLLLAGVAVYIGSKADRSGVSALWFFAAFGCFAYVMAVALAVMQ